MVKPVNSKIKNKSSRLIRNLEIKKNNLWKLSRLNPTTLNNTKYKDCVGQIKKAKIDQCSIEICIVKLL